MPAAKVTTMEKPVERKGREQLTEERPLTEEEVKAAEKLVQFVVFSLGGEEYGLPILDVKEIVKTEEITTVPNVPEFIRGIINLRGRIVVVINLEKRFMLQREEEYTGKHIVIAEIGEGIFGLMVDEVTEVLRMPEENVKPAPPIITKKINVDYLKGVGTIEKRLIILLDLQKVLSEAELVKLSESVGKQYRKIKPKKKEEKGEKKAEEKEVAEKPEEKKVEKVEEKLEGKPAEEFKSEVLKVPEEKIEEKPSKTTKIKPAKKEKGGK